MVLSIFIGVTHLKIGELTTPRDRKAALEPSGVQALVRLQGYLLAQNKAMGA